MGAGPAWLGWATAYGKSEGLTSRHPGRRAAMVVAESARGGAPFDVALALKTPAGDMVVTRRSRRRD
jgi:hypothetical protein